MSDRLRSLTRSESIRVSKYLRAKGRKLPKVGWCVTAVGEGVDRVEICRDQRGYYTVGRPGAAIWDIPR